MAVDASLVRHPLDSPNHVFAAFKVGLLLTLLLSRFQPSLAERTSKRMHLSSNPLMTTEGALGFAWDTLHSYCSIFSII